MFVFVDGLRHPFEVVGGVKFGCRFAIDGEIAEWCLVMRAAGEGGFGEIVVVRWTEEEDSLAVLIL